MSQRSMEFMTRRRLQRWNTGTLLYHYGRPTPFVQFGRQENRPTEHNIMVSGNGRRLETAFFLAQQPFLYIFRMWPNYA